MPYDGPADSSLPDYVKRMPPAKRKRWVGAFNSAYERDGDEGKAFRVANSVVKTKDLDADTRIKDALASIEAAGRALSPDEEADNPKPDLKHYDDGAVMVMEEPKPYGGAKSFTEVQEAMRAQKTQSAVSDLNYVFSVHRAEHHGRRRNRDDAAR